MMVINTEFDNRFGSFVKRLGWSTVWSWANLRFGSWGVVRLELWNLVFALIDCEVREWIWTWVAFSWIYSLHIIRLRLRLDLLLRKIRKPDRCFLGLRRNLLVWMLLGWSDYLAECPSRMAVIICWLQKKFLLNKLILARKHLIWDRVPNHRSISLIRLAYVSTSRLNRCVLCLDHWAHHGF